MTTIITRAGKGAPLSWAEVDDNFTNLNTDKAELASPTFTGTPAAPTAASGTNTTQLASCAFVKTEITADRPYSDTNPIMDSTAAQGTSPKVSRQDHVHPSDTTKANLSGATFTGGVSVKAAATGSDDGNVISGTYTPTIGALSNLSSVSVNNTFRWLRVGKVVTVSGSLSVTVGSVSSASVYLSLPVSSNFTSNYSLAGVSVFNGSGVRNVGSIQSDGATDTAFIFFYAAATGSGTIAVTYTYEII